MHPTMPQTAHRFAGYANGFVQTLTSTALLWGQGLYFLTTGLWVLLSSGSYQAEVGREGDRWLGMTVSLFVTTIALALLVAAWRRSESPEIVVLAFTSALALTGMGIFYVARRVLPPVYLLDAVVEVAFLTGWCALGWKQSNSLR